MSVAVSLTNLNQEHDYFKISSIFMD